MSTDALNLLNYNRSNKKRVLFKLPHKAVIISWTFAFILNDFNNVGALKKVFLIKTKILNFKHYKHRGDPRSK